MPLATSILLAGPRLACKINANFEAEKEREHLQREAHHHIRPSSASHSRNHVGGGLIPFSFHSASKDKKKSENLRAAEADR
ncbi:hypothetical protein L228DRAFT_243894 [Xylona heveae TC161]|uniref:Uncharacterized protein n=1 Tax=Xylona heveae (strain CBS 132557 / TC161) TaxID=1328760 RepID=A0A165IMD6_XYLHT|nr:hypothetical protein L228DRAFT_243894 [Xylona heveae TC161]KZF25104.1 hypothetical protein L228DRAFT_243894 [Xylona heveae TC161]